MEISEFKDKIYKSWIDRKKKEGKFIESKTAFLAGWDACAEYIIIHENTTTKPLK